MKTAAISRFVVAAAIAALMVVGESTVAWAQCPAPPNFTPDFGANQNCMALNGTSPAFVNTGEGNTPPTVLRLTPNSGNQVASAWFNPAQPVQNGFSTSFQFQFTTSGTSADGIAFVIQNAGLTAIGSPPNGGALGYGDDDTDQNPQTGIPNSLAIEFDVFQNTWDPPVPHVAVQSCGMGNNTSHHGQTCPNTLSSTLGGPVSTPSLTDGAIHKVTISYTPPTPSGCGEGGAGQCSGRLHVILDKVDLFPGGVAADLSNIGLTNGTAFVGFTGATGALSENQDILSWTFTPQAQSAAVGTNTPAILNFNGGVGNNNTGYDYNALLTPPDSNALSSAVVQVQPILISEEDCEKLVDANPAFGQAQCFVFQNADGKGTTSAVLYELTCPGLSGDSCDQGNFFAELGTDFVFQKADNPGFQLLNSTIGPYPGWLKGNGGVPGHPCQVDPNNLNAPLFHSNQIDSFKVLNDPTGITKGGAKPGGSCWVATYATGGERPPGVKITAPTFKTYTRSLIPGTAMYTCSDPKTSQPSSSPIGPYLTAASCSQNQAPNLNNSACSNPNNVNGVITCTGTFDLSGRGLHVFTVTSKDSGGNVGANIVLYNVR